jgi:hypothetical protein
MNSRRWLLVLATLSLGSSCLHDTSVQRERSGGYGDQAPEIKAPLQDRCVGHGKSSVRSHCDEAKYLAQLYARRLAPGDGVCLEGGFGDEPTGSCMARAAVVDTDTNRALIEIRDARPESRWFKKVQYQVWFEEGALVDLYLAERGY